MPSTSSQKMTAVKALGQGARERGISGSEIPEMAMIIRMRGIWQGTMTPAFRT
jgi:hypothetical protein